MKYRYDIVNNLPYGAMSILSKKTKLGVNMIRSILYGSNDDRQGILYAAETMAALHSWERMSAYPPNVRWWHGYEEYLSHTMKKRLIKK